MILPVLFLALAAQPTYRLGAFIEIVHAEYPAPPIIDWPGSERTPTEDDVPEPSWPVELVALFPGGIGFSEQAFRVSTGVSLRLEADSGPHAYHPSETPTACQLVRPVPAERTAAVSVGVIAHPISAHAPPSAL